MTECPLCQQANQCNVGEDCWCVSLTIPEALLKQVPADAKDKHCICQSCIETFNASFSDAAASKEP